MKLSKAVEGFIIARLADGYSSNATDSYSCALNFLIESLDIPAIENMATENLRRFFFILHTDYKPNRPGGDSSPLTRASLYRIRRALRSIYNWTSEEFEVERPDKNI